MGRILTLCLLAAGASGPVHGQTASVDELLQAVVGDVSNQEIVVLEVVYPPGAASAPHRHNAHTIVYVLEGTVVMQVSGGEKRTLGPGDTFHETPDDVHAVSMNGSETEPAKILVFFLKERGAPITVPAT